jgi:high-affinity Fe2+/Pb2+ permease
VAPLAGPVEPPGRAGGTAVAAGLALCGGLVVLFLFFWMLGAIDVGDAVAATAVAVLLALVWLAGYVYRRRAREARELARRDRERRGF